MSVQLLQITLLFNSAQSDGSFKKIASSFKTSLESQRNYLFEIRKLLYKYYKEDLMPGSPYQIAVDIRMDKAKKTSLMPSAGVEISSGLEPSIIPKIETQEVELSGAHQDVKGEVVYDFS